MSKDCEKDEQVEQKKKKTFNLVATKTVKRYVNAWEMTVIRMWFG